MERLAQQHMFSKDEPPAQPTEPANEQGETAPESGQQSAPEE
jgi:hypothetical protein